MQATSLVVEKNRQKFEYIATDTSLYKESYLFAIQLASLYILYRHCKFGLLVQKIPLMIIAINLGIALFVSTIEFNLTILLKDSSPATSALTFIESAFADHGQETTLTL